MGATKRKTKRKTKRPTKIKKHRRLRGGVICAPCFSPLASVALGAGASLFSSSSDDSYEMKNGIYTYKASKTETAKKTDKTMKKKETVAKSQSLSIVMKGTPEKGWTITKVTKGTPNKKKSQRKTIRLPKGTSDMEAKKRLDSLICECKKKGFTKC